MCLILVAWQAHPNYPLIMAANRDEFYDRPTAPADFWRETPDVLAGRDLQAGGTWMGVTRTGRFAAITNYRDPHDSKPNAPSRGALVADYLTSTQSPQAYLSSIQPNAARYNGFNLLVGDPGNLIYFSNRENEIRSVPPGVHGLSNHLLDTPWPKVVRGKAMLQAVVAEKAIDAPTILTQLKNTVIAADKELPSTGVGLELERALSSMFIVTHGYGTRSSTVLLMDAEGNATFSERTYAAPVLTFDDQTFSFATSM